MSRHGVPGYFPIGDLPQQAPIKDRVFSSGWSQFDRIFRFYPGQFTVVTGKVGHGKSTLLFNLIVNLTCYYGLKSFIYIPENERSCYNKFKKLFVGGVGTHPLDEQDFDRFVTEQCFIQSSRPEFHAKPCTLQSMLERAIPAIEKDHVELVLIDPWNYLERIKPKDQLMTEYINDCLHDMATFARCYDVMAILVAHPTKAAAADREVLGLYDIDGSAAFANKPDNGLCVARQADGTCRVHSTKVREAPDAGDIGCCNFHVDPESGKFTPAIGVASTYEGGGGKRKNTGLDF